MTGKELIKIIRDNNLENCEISDGNLMFRNDTEVVMIHPIELDYSMYPTIPRYFQYLDFYERCNWYESYLISENRKPFSQVERIPNELYEIVETVFENVDAL